MLLYNDTNFKYTCYNDSIHKAPVIMTFVTTLVIMDSSHNYQFVQLLQNQNTSGQSYKHFTLVNYDSRVVIWGIFQSGTTLES